LIRYLSYINGKKGGNMIEKERNIILNSPIVPSTFSTTGFDTIVKIVVSEPFCRNDGKIYATEITTRA